MRATRIEWRNFKFHHWLSATLAISSHAFLARSMLLTTCPLGWRTMGYSYRDGEQGRRYLRRTHDSMSKCMRMPLLACGGGGGGHGQSNVDQARSYMDHYAPKARHAPPPSGIKQVLSASLRMNTCQTSETTTEADCTRCSPEFDCMQLRTYPWPLLRKTPDARFGVCRHFFT